ncbi:hypothetical protein [Streptomyces wedmorensis]|uniref:hypothetical protein n=1 Tax=Streptomyces wedmorensis TaxID=43759 RepID=UPI0037B28037
MGLPLRSDPRPGAGGKVANAQLRNLNPFPANLGEVLKRYEQVLMPEMNLGQLALLLRAKHLVDARSCTRVSSTPFKAEQIPVVIKESAPCLS